MTKAENFSAFAAECLRWSRHARVAEERKSFLELAEMWTEQAAIWMEQEAKDVERGRIGPDQSALRIVR